MSTLEQIELVRGCALLGMTAAQAGKKLGMTRGAVLGVAHRNEIKFHGRHNKIEPSNKPAVSNRWAYGAGRASIRVF